MSEQIQLPDDVSTPPPRTVSSVSVTLQDDALVVAFALTGERLTVRWVAHDPVAVRDLARQFVTLAEGMPGAESMCLCALFRPTCPVHRSLLETGQ
jgi:hypothetical protein